MLIADVLEALGSISSIKTRKALPEIHALAEDVLYRVASALAEKQKSILNVKYLDTESAW